MARNDIDPAFRPRPDKGIQINYAPDNREDIFKRAENLKKVREGLEKSKIVPQEVLHKPFDI